MVGRPGTYQLVIRLSRPKTIQVGRLGRFRFAAGYYVYTGSAMRGLQGRLARHLRRNKRTHWHIDYLLQFAEIRNIHVYPSRRRQECQIHSRLARQRGACCPITGFGSSDCQCESHLLYFQENPLPHTVSLRRKNSQ